MEEPLPGYTTNYGIPKKTQRRVARFFLLRKRPGIISQKRYVPFVENTTFLYKSRYKHNVSYETSQRGMLQKCFHPKHLAGLFYPQVLCHRR